MMIQVQIPACGGITASEGLNDSYNHQPDTAAVITVNGNGLASGFFRFTFTIPK
ncbi:hypothetical protein [Neisseria sp.]|uniref:hypothetical protein n=1 Tax=Neisseria sp. TaxID=192066 RepID=UPI0035A0469D